MSEATPLPQPSAQHAPATPDPATAPPVQGAPVSANSPLSATAVAEPPADAVVGGLAFAGIGILAGIIVSVLIWRLGFVASIGSFLMALAAVRLYTKGAGAPPRRGAIALVALICLGIVLSFFACLVSDLWVYYSEHEADFGPETRRQFITDNVFYGPVLSGYSREMIMFAIFGVIGTAATMIRVLKKDN